MKHYEDAEQITVMEWARLIPMHERLGARIADFLFAIPNGGRRGKIEAARFKRMGVKPGVSDLFLALPSGGYHGFWIEMKKQRQHFASDRDAERAVAPEQRDFLELMRWAGYDTMVAYGADEAINAIQLYLAEDSIDASTH